MSAEPVSEVMASMLSTCATVRVWAEQDDGPYHRDAQPSRRDIVDDRDGVALQLGVRLVGDDTTPVRDATVEIWQCDALVRYSGFPPPNDATVVTAADAPRGEYLPDQTFLRGRLQPDDAGMVEFRTICPGWYPGRTVHIHAMVHAGDTTFTSQLYFPDDLNDRVLSLELCSQRPGRDTTNDTDDPPDRPRPRSPRRRPRRSRLPRRHLPRPPRGVRQGHERAHHGCRHHPGRIPLPYLAALAAASNDTPGVLIDGYAYGSPSMTCSTIAVCVRKPVAPTLPGHSRPRRPPSTATSDHNEHDERMRFDG